MKTFKLNFRKMPNYRLTKDLVMGYLHLHKRFFWFYIAYVAPDHNTYNKISNCSKTLMDIKNKIVNGRYKFHYVEDMHYYSITHVPMLYKECEFIYFNDLEELTNTYIQDFI